MPESYPFPMYSGIFEPKHYKQIGAALWFFSWCIKSTTKESVDEEGETWGYVFKGKPMKLSELAEPFGVNDKTVSRWVDTLEHHGYIRITRAPYGLIIAVKKSKKGLDKNVRSEPREQTNMSDHYQREQTNMSDLEQENRQICPITTERTDISVRSNNDLKDLTTTITTTTDNGIVSDGNVEPFIELISAYCELHKKLDFHVKPKERGLMHRMIAGGMPVPFIIRVMNQLYGERCKETNITSFLYYENPISEAWHNEQSQTTPEEGVVAKGEVRQGSQHRNKKQQDLDDMDRVIEEERNRGAIPVS